MPVLSITRYFPFPMVGVIYRSVSREAQMAVIDLWPDKRFRPVCSNCLHAGGAIYRNQVRPVGDLNLHRTARSDAGAARSASAGRSSGYRSVCIDASSVHSVAAGRGVCAKHSE